ncbi:hypothetical protein [Roseovarius arcticus]|uniref:hypothetical protein n=1 Tax=Roseovarius arcticus TaxID=2547404 RepID=UPI001110D03C|nr:hypothetical protein [Roseovarius arcticus]
MQDHQTTSDTTLDCRTFGPQPKEALRAFVDLGLTDREIGKYHGVSPSVVSTLLKHYRIAKSNDEAEASKADPLMGEVDNDVYLSEILRVKGESMSLTRPGSEVKPDPVKLDLRRFALSVRSKMFDGQ